MDTGRRLINLSETKIRDSWKTKQPIEVNLPEEIKSKGVTRLAAEYRTICITYYDNTIRFSFFASDITRTISAYNQVSNRLVFTSKFGYEIHSLSNAVRQLIVDKWLILIGVTTQEDKT